MISGKQLRRLSGSFKWIKRNNVTEIHSHFENIIAQLPIVSATNSGCNEQRKVAKIISAFCNLVITWGSAMIDTALLNIGLSQMHLTGFLSIEAQ